MGGTIRVCLGTLTACVVLVWLAGCRTPATPGAAEPLPGAVYYVDGAHPSAADTNPGTASLPWKTLARAGTATNELRPGDTILIRTGVYRETFKITVCGTPDRPIVFAAAPGAKVVVKGSEVIRGRWTKVSQDPSEKEPYPNAFNNVWKIQLGEEFFTDPDFPHSYGDPAKRWLSQVFMNDYHPLQRIGPDPIYSNEPYAKLRYVGRGLEDMIDDSFWFDPLKQTLYVRLGGEPGWYVMEAGVRGWTLVVKAHDVVVRGLEFRHNRMPAGQWPMASVTGERVTIEDCSFRLADFCGLGIGGATNCTVRRCDLSYNGNTGISLHKTTDCTVEDCTILFNNYRHFHAGWHAGGMKSIPENVRATVRRCEAAYNIASPSLWFDAFNEDIRLLDNVCHHNGTDGIFFEINPKGGLIAGNLCYANQSRGIYNSGSADTWIVHNTVAANVGGGIVVMPREDPFKVENVRVLNNLMLGNYITEQNINRGCDLVLFVGAGGPEWAPTARTIMSNHSDYNIYANNPWTPYLRHSWNPNNTLAQWRERFGEDLHSMAMAVDFDMTGTGFELRTLRGLDIAAPLPEEVTRLWKPNNPRRVGADRTRWP